MARSLLIKRDSYRTSVVLLREKAPSMKPPYCDVSRFTVVEVSSFSGAVFLVITNKCLKKVG